MLVTVLLACGTAAPPDHGHDRAHGHAHDPAAPKEHDHDHGAGQDHDPSEHHAGGSDHMAKMTATRDALRAELGPAYDAPVPGLDAADPARGQPLYDTHCASCHGAVGKGDGPAGQGLNPPPADFTDAFHARFYSDAGRVRIVEKGSPGTAMAGFDAVLDRQQIVDLYAYVRKFRESGGR